MKAPHYPFLDLKIINAPYMHEIEEAVRNVVTSGRYIGGEECERLEETLKVQTGAPYAVGVSNGLDALRLTLRAWVDRGDLKKGDEVVVASNTYIASILAIIDAGLRPVLAPVDMLTLNIDTARLEESLTPRTRVVMPVHLYGRACWDIQLKEFVEKNQLLVIEDNAQGIGARTTTSGLMGTHVTGGLGHAGAFSFYPTKNIGAMGDAGAIVTHDGDLAARVRALSNYGSDRRYHNIIHDAVAQRGEHGQQAGQHGAGLGAEPRIGPARQRIEREPRQTVQREQQSHFPQRGETGALPVYGEDHIEHGIACHAGRRDEREDDDLTARTGRERVRHGDLTQGKAAYLRF